MNKPARFFIAAGIVTLLLLPVGGLHEKVTPYAHSSPSSFSGDATTTNINDDDVLDQSQMVTMRSCKIYQDRWAAQSFIPTEDIITRVQLYIVALNRTDSMLSLLPQVLTDRPLLHTVLSLFAQNHVSNIGDVVVSIRSTLEGDDLVSVSKSFAEVQNSSDKGWVEFDFDNIDARDYMYTQMYIVVRASGGSSAECYKWYRSIFNQYPNGEMFYSKKRIRLGDFCFKTYGKDKSGDGITTGYAIMVGIADYPPYGPGGPDLEYYDRTPVVMKQVLCSKGSDIWKSNNFYIFTESAATVGNVNEAFKAVDRLEDSDDIFYFLFAGHGGNAFACFYDGAYNYSTKLNENLNKLGAKGILVTIDACYSGSCIDYCSNEGRIILTSSAKNKKSYGPCNGIGGVFDYYFIKGLKGSADECDPTEDNWKFGNEDGDVSAEEAFLYAKEWTKDDGFGQVPQMDDRYQGELVLTHV